MEEDIKILEEMVEKSRDLREEDFYKLIGIKQIQAIATFIKAYKELEEKQKSYNTAYNQGKAFENHRWKSLLKEKIEELNEYYKKEIYPSLINWSDVDITEYYDGMIEILQELLEKKK